MIGIINAEERFRTLRQTQCVVLQKLTKRRPTTISPLYVHILPATTSGSATVVPVNSAVCTPVVNPEVCTPVKDGGKRRLFVTPESKKERIGS